MRLSTWSCTVLLLSASTLHPAFADTAQGVTVVTADMDNDGNAEIVALDPADQQVDIIWVDSAGNFTLRGQDFSDITDMTCLAVADVNGDGWPDVVIGEGSGTVGGVRVLLNNGDGTLSPDVAYSSGPLHTHGPVAVTLADVNGDGHPDIITANETAGTVTILLNLGDGTFGAPITYPAGGQPVAVVAADLNGDTHPDLVVADFTGNSVQILLNNGDGSFAAPVAQAVGSQPVALTLADVDGDGKLDIEVADQADNTAGVLLGYGDGSFQAATFYRTGGQPGWIAASDLDGDGRLDLVTDNYSDGSVSLFSNSGHGFGSPQQLFPAYGSYGTVVMSIQGVTQVVSTNVAAGQVQVTAAAAAVKQGNSANGSVHHINGDRDPQSSSGSGAIGIVSLALLALAGLVRRRAR